MSATELGADPLYCTAEEIRERMEQAAAPAAPPRPTGAYGLLPASPTALHEAAHVVVARWLGMPVALATVAGEGGETWLAVDPSADGRQRAAVATAAGVAIDRKLGLDEALHGDDLHRIGEYRQRFRYATGYEMPDPFAAAEPFFADPAFGRDLIAVARHLDAAGRIECAQIDALVVGPPAPEYEYAI